MLTIKTVRAAWSQQRSCWRLDIQYRLDDADKRTFLQVSDAAQDQVQGEAAAKKAARDFVRGVSAIYHQFIAKFDETRPKPAPRPVTSPMKVRRGAIPTVSWLLSECLSHREVWGAVKHPKNYISGVKKLNAIVGNRLVSEFEPPHGRKLVMEVVKSLRAEGSSDGYVRKVAYQLRQALCAAIGKGVDEPILHPDTDEPLLRDIPTFPNLPKSKGRTAILEQHHDQIVFLIIRARFAKAREEERVFREKIGNRFDLQTKAKGNIEMGGQIVWLNARRFTSGDWSVFERYIRFLLETGCRRSEALSVGRHSIREQKVIGDDGAVTESFPTIHLSEEVTKTGKSRVINLSPTIQSAIPFWNAFARPHTFKIGARAIEVQHAWFPLMPNQITGLWEHVRKDAKDIHGVDLSKVSPHQLRHTHATRMSERGLSGKALSDTLGHTDERTTRIYDHSQSVHQSRKFFANNVSGSIHGGGNPSQLSGEG